MTIAQQMAVESDRSEATIKRDVRKGRVLKASGLDKDTACGVIKDIPSKVVEELEPLKKLLKPLLRQVNQRLLMRQRQIWHRQQRRYVIRQRRTKAALRPAKRRV